MATLFSVCVVGTKIASGTSSAKVYTRESLPLYQTINQRLPVSFDNHDVCNISMDVLSYLAIKHVADIAFSWLLYHHHSLSTLM